MPDQATLEILISIRDELAGLSRARAAIGEAKTEAKGLGAALKEGLGIGTGFTMAVGAIALLKDTLLGTVKASLNLAEQVRDGAGALEISTDSYQVLRLELAKAGVEMGRLDVAYSSQVTSMASARDIASSAATAYRVLGLDIAELERMPFDARLLAIARATTQAKDQTAAYEAAGQLLGSRGLPRLLAALRTLSTEGFDKVAASAKAAGRVMDEDTAERLDRAKKTWEGVINWAVVQSGSLIDALLHPLDNTPWSIIEAAAARQAAADAAAAAARNRTASPQPLEQTTVWRQKELDLTVAQTREQLANADAISTEEGKRLKLVNSLQAQLGIEQQLLTLAQTTPLTQKENQYDREKLKTDLQNKIQLLQQQVQQAQSGLKPAWKTRQESLAAIDNPDLNSNYMTSTQGLQAGMQNWLIGLGSTGEQVSKVLESTLGSAVSSISNDIWGAMKGTNEWSDIWSNLADVAGKALTQIIVQMMTIQAINSALGLFGYSTDGLSISQVKSAGGGTFVTNGPTDFTVGDNPGGVELVSVLPLSGIGRTTVRGSVAQLGGGGMVLAAGGGGSGGVNYSQTLVFGGGVSREQVLGMIPQIVAQTKAAVREAQRRHRDGF